MVRPWAMNGGNLSSDQRPPSHYHEVDPRSNTFSDIMARLRIYGPWDVKTSVAHNELVAGDCLTREHVRKVLDRAKRVTTSEHDDWLREGARDAWTYDHPDPRPKFDDYFNTLKRQIYLPNHDKTFRSDTQHLFTIDGLPAMYLLLESTQLQGRDDPIVDSRHFVDLGCVVAPFVGVQGNANFLA